MSVNFSQLTEQETIIKTATGSFAVKAIPLAGLVNIITRYKDTLNALDFEHLPEFASFVALYPDLVASVIAEATDSQGQEESIKRLPAPVTLQALVAIWQLSVPDTEAFLNTVTLLASEVKKLAPA